MGDGEVVSDAKSPKTRMCSTGATWFGSTSMNGTAGEASWTISGPAHTATTTSHQAAGRDIRKRTGPAKSGRRRRVATYAAATAACRATSSGQSKRPKLPSRKSTAASRTTAAANPANTTSETLRKAGAPSQRSVTAPASTFAAVAIASLLYTSDAA